MDELQARIDRILNKYFARASSLNLATGGQVEAEAFSEFLKTTGLESTPLMNAIVAAGGLLIREGDPIHIPTIGLAARQLLKATKGTAPGSVVSFTTGEAEISTTEVIYPVDLDYQDYEDAIGRMPEELGEAAQNAYLDQATGDLVMAAISRDLQDLLLNGDTLSGTTFLQTFDGALKLVAAGGTHYNPGAAQTIKEFLRGLYRAATANLRAAKRNLVFWLNSTDYDDVWDLYDSRMTGLGDSALKQDMDGQLTYHGIPVVELDQLPEYKSFLAKKNAFYVGMRRRMTTETQRQARKRVVEITVSARVGHAEVLDYLVLGTHTP